MSERSLTLLEIHLGDGTIQIGPRTIGSKMETEAASEADEAANDNSEADGCPLRTPLLGLLALGVVAAIAAVVWKQVGARDLDDAVALDDLDD